MTPIADIDRIARCIGNRTQYPWRFSKLFVPQLRASRRSKRKSESKTFDTAHSAKRNRISAPQDLPLTSAPGGPLQRARLPRLVLRRLRSALISRGLPVERYRSFADTRSSDRSG